MPSSPLLRLSLALFLFSCLAWLAQASHEEEYPGHYPLVQEPIQGRFVPTEDGFRVELTEGTKSGRLVVFAYNDAGEMLGVLKPIIDGVVELHAGDLADFRLQTHGREVGDYRLLKAMDRYLEREDMVALLRTARAQGLRYGVQRCLYPICNRCVDGCKTVIRTGQLPIRMEVGDGGHVHPFFAKGRCPRCGKCFVWCPSGVLTETRSLVN